jgi:hypothetical protein
MKLFININSIQVLLIVLITGCTGYYGQSPKEFVKRSEKVQEFKKRIECGKSIQQLLELSYIDNCRMAINPDVDYSGLNKSNYKGTTLVVRLLSNTTERVFIAVGLDKTLNDKEQKYNYKSPFLKTLDAKIMCYYISDSSGYSVHCDKNGLLEYYENKVIETSKGPVLNSKKQKG